MDDQQLKAYVSQFRLQDLTLDKFDSFVQQAAKIFMPLGTQIGINYRAGYNELSIGWYLNGNRPVWNQTIDGLIPESISRTTKFEVRNLRRNTPFLLLGTLNTGHEWFGIRETLPFRFAFEPEKALYVVDRVHNGNEEFPSEQLFFRRDHY